MYANVTGDFLLAIRSCHAQKVVNLRLRALIICAVIHIYICILYMMCERNFTIRPLHPLRSVSLVLVHAHAKGSASRVVALVLPL